MIAAVIASANSANRSVIESIKAKLDSGQPFTLADIRNTATVLKERQRSMDPERAVDSGTVGKLIGALQRDRDAALQASGFGPVATAYRQMDDEYGAVSRSFRGGTPGAVLDQREPGVFSMARGDVVDAIAKASPREIQLFRTALTRNPAGLQQFEDAIRQRLAASVRGEGGIASGDKLMRALAAGTREGDAIRAALPPDQIKNLERIAHELSLAQRQPANLGFTEDARVNILRKIARIYLAPFSTRGRVMTAAQSAMQAQAKTALERAIMDPRHLSDLVRLSRMMPGSRAARDLAAGLGIEALASEQ